MRVWAVRVLGPVAGAEAATALRPAATGWLSECCDGVVVVGRPDSRPTRGWSLLEALRAGSAQVPDDVEAVALVDPEGLSRADPATVAEMRRRLEAPGVAAVVRGAPVTDALKRVAGDLVTGSVDREGLFAPRTPLLVRLSALAEATGGAEPTGDPVALLARRGLRIEVLPSAVPAAAPARAARAEGSEWR